ncbi:MAG: HAD-IA family hydrolase, partial [Candidatus Nanohaloarchaea archaeon]
FATAWEDREAERTTFRGDATRTVTGLADRYRTGIATNGTGRLQRMKLADAGIKDVLDSIVISSEIGVTKPNSDFFDAARDAVEAETHVMVSTELRRDILP